ncbi:ZIP family metal transporter [Neisseria sp. Ec49-e6-T10]|uniref:ZIP family metal transporter n=1 Tax=Neisseria sp. Ec49-e6-T10 TaxID=3140744 RepID=UPI003EBFC450
MIINTPVHLPLWKKAGRHSWILVGSTVMLVLLFLLIQAIWFSALDEQKYIFNAFIGGSVAALATALGTLPILFSRNLSERMMDCMMGFGAGVMLAASVFSLILPGMEAIKQTGAGPWEAGFVIGGAILLGGLLLLVMEHALPHEHFLTNNVNNDTNAVALKRTWLFVFAICLHNVPEGLAIGVGFAGVGNVAGSTLATGIAIQDIPEGLVVALALLGAGYSKRTCILIGIFSGLVEPIGAVIGATIITSSAQLLPWGLGFAAGAMLFVISHEIIPESHRKGHEAFATGGLMIGFVLMMLLDTALA